MYTITISLVYFAIKQLKCQPPCRGMSDKNRIKWSCTPGKFVFSLNRDDAMGEDRELQIEGAGAHPVAI